MDSVVVPVGQVVSGKLEGIALWRCSDNWKEELCVVLLPDRSDALGGWIAEMLGEDWRRLNKTPNNINWLYFDYDTNMQEVIVRDFEINPQSKTLINATLLLRIAHLISDHYKK